MSSDNDILRTDKLIAAQTQTAVTTLAAAIIQARNATDVPSIIGAYFDAQHIISPDYKSSDYREWLMRNGLSTSWLD